MSTDRYVKVKFEHVTARTVAASLDTRFDVVGGCDEESIVILYTSAPVLDIMDAVWALNNGAFVEVEVVSESAVDRFL